MEIYIGESTPVCELADLLDVPAAAVVRDRFYRLGLLLTIQDVLSFEQARSIAENRGATVRRKQS